MGLVNFFKEDVDGHAEQHDPANDEISLLRIAFNPAVAGDSVINGGGGKATNFVDGVAATDLTTKQQLDAVIAGATAKAAVRLATIAALPAYTAAGSGVGKTLTATTNGILTVDGVAAVLGDRILVKDETAGADVDHGLYELTTEGTASIAFVLTRATDYDGTPVGEVKNGTYTFVTAGTQVNTGWMMITSDPVTVDTTAMEFSKFQGLPAFVWGAGILDTANTISVELDTAATAQAAGNGGGSSGLEFDAAGNGAQLRAAVHATAGLERTASGLGIRLNGTTLQTLAGGASVKGVPSLFELGGVAVGANVTAPNLDTLTGGAATTLHSHAGATEAERIETAYTTDGVGATIGDPVFTSANDVVSTCDAANANAKKFIGLAKTTAGAAAPLDVVGAGVLAGLTVAGAPGFGKYCYIANGGGLTTVKPNTSGDYRYIVGIMKNATDVQVVGEYLNRKA